MDKEKYVKWYNIAKEVVADEKLVPIRTDDEIKKLVSQEDWLMFVLEEFDDTTEAKNASAPNVFMDLFRDDNKEFGRIGLTFNNVKSVDVLKNILSKYCKNEKEALTKLLLSLDGAWEITVSRKIKDTYHLQTPVYQREYHNTSNQIDDTVVDQIIFWVNKIREEGTEKRKSLLPKYYSETPSVNLLESIFILNEEVFKTRIKEAFEILKICLDVKSNREIKTIVKSKNTELVELEEELESKEKKWSNRDNYLRLGLATEEDINKLGENIKKIKEKIESIKKELE